MTDTVERLKMHTKGLFGDVLPSPVREAMQEAATEIAQLKRELSCRDALIKDHLAKIMHLENRVDVEAYRAEAFEAEVKRLREAAACCAECGYALTECGGHDERS